ncbi:hypothetical protein PPSIR1_26743 [Plesiocystis pacifica SIR-1]|uniref:Uncharacterized protein n=1 Tax=Plesiocystis pacifica SIR-1 TaxID=391625 RepID=A6GAB4_9BACT|nr:hypothetical protein PPSIR1_26743 [Plesiocystis pacifica SIR-1]
MWEFATLVSEPAGAEDHAAASPPRARSPALEL